MVKSKDFFAATSLYTEGFMFMPVFLNILQQLRSLGNSYHPSNFTYEELFLPNFCVAFLLAWIWPENVNGQSVKKQNDVVEEQKICKTLGNLPNVCRLVITNSQPTMYNPLVLTNKIFFIERYIISY